MDFVYVIIIIYLYTLGQGWREVKEGHITWDLVDRAVLYK